MEAFRSLIKIKVSHSFGSGPHSGDTQHNCKLVAIADGKVYYFNDKNVLSKQSLADCTVYLVTE